jgi:uncharacterized protein YodC (DUF2158 family)
VDTFAVGDVVQLKSGGLSMTVEEVKGKDVTCVWFEGPLLKRQTFVLGTLKQYVRPGIGMAVLRS